MNLVGRRFSKLTMLAMVAALSFTTSYLLLLQFDPPAWQQPFLPRVHLAASSAPCASTRKVFEDDGHHPPFIKIEELLTTAGDVSRQRRAPGCPPEGTLCRLEDVFDEIFVISLPRATDRLARVRAQLAALGVPYTLVHALEGKLMAGAHHLAKLVMTNLPDQHPGLAGVGVVVAPRNASFLHRWLAKARDQHLADDYQSQAVALRLAERHTDEAKLLSHAAFYPRSSSPHHLKVAYQADDCASEHESFSVHRFSASRPPPPPPPPPAATEGGGEESAADELEAVWLGEGSLHRVARAIVRKALAGGRLCAMAEREVRRLEAQGGAPTCAPPSAPS
ncbi:uncharacterized protein ACA1_059050 [Acanthamoeba castellanii str. Neff]|uniref:Uncharacterized protein n=1 Tax=Acanthamoeba castellanii (strain ATCC 30010 / Neff) TaxID=1257118 RepID=L8GXC6_ACACF|nr:uncharacterized protein ACA1_059050 [Acanthamoeba castellanii str. Neff]ELR17228.1 hypothetical protein ACA1_059050 [Acanthamoeba castellanii str. Neff]